jgi:hypothetical protein
VHAWGYDRLAKNDQVELSNATFELVVKAINGCINTPEDKLRLVPHVMANFTTVAGISGALYQTAEGIHSTLHELTRIGIFMTNIGRLQGFVIETFVLNNRKRVLGKQHPFTIFAMNHLPLMLSN